jgi:hypothetical protein
MLEGIGLAFSLTASVTGLAPEPAELIALIFSGPKSFVAGDLICN